MRYRDPHDQEQVQRREDLAYYRKRLGLSLPEMATKLKVAAFRLDKIEKGIQPCSEELVLAASEIWELQNERFQEDEDREFWD